MGIYQIFFNLNGYIANNRDLMGKYTITTFLMGIHSILPQKKTDTEDINMGVTPKSAQVVYFWSGQCYLQLCFKFAMHNNRIIILL
jgi:hypothetical protein